MVKEQPEHIIPRGQPPLSNKYGEDTKPFRVLLPISQHEYVANQAALLNISAAEYIRRLIAHDMANLSEPQSK